MSDLSKILSVENEEEECEVASTPIRTVRALKNKYSSQTNIASRDDHISEVNGNNMSKSSVPNLGFGFQQNQNAFKSLKNIAEDNTDQSKAVLGVKQPQFQRKQLHSLTTTLPQRISNRENENTHQFNALELPLEDHTPYAKTELQIGRQQLVGQNAAKEQLKTPMSSSRTDLSILLPLNDKTNVQSEKNQFVRRFKKRVETMNEIPTIVREQENQSRIQYQNIDIEYGIRLVMSKSKRLRDKIERENISEQFLAKTIWQSKPFKIEYSMFLLQQVHLKVISAEFKNLNKKAFDKLENFFIVSIDRARHKEILHGDYLRHSNSVQSLFQKQIDDLNAQLNNPNKISFDEKEEICV